MKRIISGFMLVLLSIDFLMIININPVKGWAGAFSPYNLHEKMTRDTFEGLIEAGLWSAEDIGDIPEHSNEVDQVLPHCKLSCHRVTQYQRVFESYGGDVCEFAGAEWEASYYISMARKSYVAGKMDEFHKYLGYAIHYIQDAACPPHVFPFQEGVGNAHFDFEEYTAREYDNKNWKQLIKNAPINTITNIKDLLTKVNDTANWVNATFQPPRVSYIRQDGVSIGILPEGWDWFMTDEDIGEIMQRIAGLVKGAVLYACSKKIESIQIKSDGSINPQDAPISKEGDVYTFIDNIYAPITVERSNIVIDGQGYTLYGTGYGGGFGLGHVINVTITNVKIEDCYTGISIQASSNCKIYGCSLKNNGHGIYLTFFHNQTSRKLEYSMNNSIYENVIMNNIWDGIKCENALYNKIYQNIVKNNQREAGIMLVGSRFNSIYDNEIVNNGNISWLSIGGLALEGSSYNSIFNNNISNNICYGIGINAQLYYWGINSTKNYIAENIIVNNYACGIHLYYNSSFNVIYGNKIANNGNYGILVEHSISNSLSCNNITNNFYGIWLNDAKRNSVYGNNLTNNRAYGIRLTQCENNEIWHNNFINNTQNANIDKASEFKNYWNRIYPYGGNYWSDYVGVDEKSGPLQNQPGSDGFGDTPYFGRGFTDSYPSIDLCRPEISRPDFWIIASLDISSEKELGKPISMRIAQGNSRTITIIMMAIYGVNQSIQLESFMWPETPGITLIMIPPQVTLYPSGFATATLTVTVETTAEPGNYQLFCWGSPLISLEVTTSKFIFNASWEGINYPVIIFTNSTITKFNFNQSLALISFIIEGEAEMMGYCNVTIPKALLKGEPWAVKLNSTDWSFTTAENETHSFIYFTFTYASSYEVIIQGTWVVPEFPSTALILVILMLTTLMATTNLRTKRKQHAPKFSIKIIYNMTVSHR